MLRAMTGFPASFVMQIEGCITLRHQGGKSVETHIAMLRAGALHATVVAFALETEANSITTTHALQLLQMLLGSSEARAAGPVPEKKEAEAAAESAMARFPSEHDLQHKGSTIVSAVEAALSFSDTNSRTDAV